MSKSVIRRLTRRRRDDAYHPGHPDGAGRARPGRAGRAIFTALRDEMDKLQKHSYFRASNDQNLSAIDALLDRLTELGPDLREPPLPMRPETSIFRTASEDQ